MSNVAQVHAASQECDVEMEKRGGVRVSTVR